MNTVTTNDVAKLSVLRKPAYDYFGSGFMIGKPAEPVPDFGIGQFEDILSAKVLGIPLVLAAGAFAAFVWPGFIKKVI